MAAIDCIEETRLSAIGATPGGRPFACQHCAIRHHAVCASLTDEELVSLNAIARHRSFKAGSTLQLTDEPARFVANVEEGVIKLERGLKDGRQQIVGLLFSADFLGRSFADLAGCTAIAVTDVTLCSYPQDEFEDLLQKFPGLEERLFSDTLAELERAQSWLLLLGRKTAQERLATFLIMLADRHSLDSCRHLGRSSDAVFDLPLTRTEIADYLGLTIETVSRQLGKLRKAGVVTVEQNRRITITDRQALLELTGE